VVQNVRKNALQLHADAFRHSNGFLDGQIQIPVRQANESTEAAVSGIQAKNRARVVFEGRFRILEDIDR
jgi:hypothetical protein